MKRLFLLLLLAALLLSACKKNTPPSENEDLKRFTEQTPTWGECPAELFQDLGDFLDPVADRVECTTVKAPLDWTTPGFDEVDVGVVRVKAGDSAKRKGAILVNPGGPGGDGLLIGAATGLRFATATEDVAAFSLLNQLSEQYDVIGFSPRGVGESFNFTCAQNRLLPKTEFYTDRSSDNVQAMLESAEVQANACLANPLYKYIDTEQTARDMDLIRTVMGDEKLNYLGYSYGSWLGHWYAKLFPETTGHMVLDSNTEFSASFQESFGLQPLGFQRAFEDVALAFAVRNNNFFPLGDSVEEAYRMYEALLPDLKAVLQYGDSALFNDLYDSSRMPDLALKLLAAKGANEVILGFEDEPTPETVQQALADYTFSPDVDTDTLAREQAFTLIEEFIGYTQREPALVTLGADSAVFHAIRCNDTPWTSDPQYWIDAGNEANETYPFLGGAVTENPCTYWEKPTTTKPDTAAEKLPPILLVQSELDAATPSEGALRAFETLPNAGLVFIENEMSHGLFPYGTDCVDTKIARYLLGGKLPSERTSTCKAKPLPGETEVYPAGSMAAPTFSLQSLANTPQNDPLGDLIHEIVERNAYNFSNH